MKNTLSTPCFFFLCAKRINKKTKKRSKENFSLLSLSLLALSVKSPKACRSKSAMKINNKGKVHPSPPLPSFPLSIGNDCLSVLRLLPAVILALVSALSPEDRQVLAYLITRSLKTPTAVSAGGRSPSDLKKISTKKAHKPPLFDCECFDCYTSYWFRWDSSPNRELIHQIIEAFEDHLTKGEKNSASQKSNGRGGKKKDKSRRRRVVEPSGRPEEPISSKITEPVVASDEVTPEKSPEMMAVETEKPTEIVRFSVAAATGHKGLARKVLPDVLGLFNSRFWRLWNPNA